MSGKLFLICPTDFIEQPIKMKINSDCFFYTALGLNFHWEINTVQEILYLVEQFLIDDIVFVSDFRNRFYIDCLDNKKTLKSCASALEICLTIKSVEPKYYFNKIYDEKLKLLASKHMLRQENNLKQLLDSKQRYKISSLLFDKILNTFLKPNYFSLSLDSQLN
jgi:hypothetical protein